MAGSFPDVPGPRMSYDKDGSVVVKYNSVDDEVVTVPTLNVTKLNSEDNLAALTINTQPAAEEFYLGIMFPENRSINGIFVCGVLPVVGAADQFMDIDVEYSTDTTTFLDGTWTSAATGITFATKTKTAYRSGIISLSIPSAIAIRIIDRANSGNTGQIKNLHLYGSILNDSDRLAFWHPVDDVPLPGSWFDYGNVKQSTYAIKEFRLKNLSTVATATDIRISTQALTDTVPTNVSQHKIEYTDPDNDPTTQPYADFVIIDSLAPGELTEKIKYKRQTLSNAIVSTWSVRLFADVIGGWIS